jgi:OOP family OmpA-OmpF porin
VKKIACAVVLCVSLAGSLVEAQSRKTKVERLHLPGPVLFQKGSFLLAPGSEEALQVVVAYLKKYPAITKMRIEGHTHMQGDHKVNLILSERRAVTVSRWLVAHGVDCKRLVPVGFGESRPIVKIEKTEDDRATNRRIMFINAELEGKPIMGMSVDGGASQLAGDPCK